MGIRALSDARFVGGAAGATSGQSPVLASSGHYAPATPSAVDSTAVHDKGDWSSSATYATHDLVKYNGKAYVAIAPSGPGTPSVVGRSGLTFTGNPSGATVTLPAGAQAGDLAVVLSVWNNTTPAASNASGWTINFSGAGFGGFGIIFAHRILTSGDITSGSITFPYDSTNSSHAVLDLRVLRNVDACEGVHDGSGLTTTSFTPTHNGIYLEYVQWYDDTTPATGLSASGVTDVRFSQWSTALEIAVGSGYETATSGTAIPARTFVIAGGATTTIPTWGGGVFYASGAFPAASFKEYASDHETANSVTGATGAQTVPDTAYLNVYSMVGNCTFTMPTAAAGKTFEMVCIQDSTGSRTGTFPGTVKNPPTLTTTANKIDWFRFTCYDGTNWIRTTLASAV